MHVNIRIIVVSTNSRMSYSGFAMTLCLRLCSVDAITELHFVCTHTYLGIDSCNWKTCARGIREKKTSLDTCAIQIINR